MKLTHETLVDGNPMQILLPRFTVSQIMRNDQQVSFRIFFTANYNTFTSDDYLVVKYAEPDEDGMPKADGEGFVKYFRLDEDIKPAIEDNKKDVLVFGRLAYRPESKDFSIDWSDSAVSRAATPSPTSLSNAVMELSVTPPITKPDRVLKGRTPTEKAIAAQTMDNRARNRHLIKNKTDEYKQDEMRAMAVIVPSIETVQLQNQLQRDKERTAYSEMMEIPPETPLGTIPIYNTQMDANNTRVNGNQSIKDSRYRLSLDGKVVAVSHAKDEEEDKIRELAYYARYGNGDDVDDIDYCQSFITKVNKLAGHNPPPNLRMFYAKRLLGINSFYNASISSSFLSENTSMSEISTYLQTGPKALSTVIEGNEESFADSSIMDDVLPKLTDEQLLIVRDQLTRRSYVRFIAKYNKYILTIHYEYTDDAVDFLQIYAELLKAFSKGGVEVDLKWLHDKFYCEGDENEDDGVDDSFEGDNGGAGDMPSDEEEPGMGRSRLTKVYTAPVELEEVTTDDEGGDDDVIAIDREEENAADDADNADGGGANNDNDLNDVGGENGGNNGGDFDISPWPPTQPPEQPDKPPNPPVNENTGPRVRNHLRPFKCHTEPGYDPVTGDLVWKVQLGFDGHFNTFEDYVRFFTDAICGRAREEAYMASTGRVVPDNAEIIDALAMIAQRRLYFRSNPGYVYCYWDHCSPRLRRLFQPPHYFRDHYSRHLYWYLICGTANCTELKKDTFKILIGRQAFVNRGQEVVISSHTPITIPGNSFFNPMWIEIRDENDELYELQTPYIIEWTFQPIRPA